MSERVEKSNLQVAKPIYNLVTEQIIPGTDMDPEQFWDGFSAIIEDLAPVNRQLLEIRKVASDFRL